MIVTGIIKSINVSDDNSSYINNLYEVDIGVFKSTANLLDSSSRVTCTACMLGGIYTPYNVGDAVYVDFVNDKTGDPVILGLIYKGLDTTQNGARAFDNLESLTVWDNAKLPSDTEIGSVKFSDVVSTIKNTANTLEAVKQMDAVVVELGNQISSIKVELGQIELKVGVGNVVYKQETVPDDSFPQQLPPKYDVLKTGDLWYNTTTKQTLGGNTLPTGVETGHLWLCLTTMTISGTLYEKDKWYVYNNSGHWEKTTAPSYVKGKWYYCKATGTHAAGDRSTSWEETTDSTVQNDSSRITQQADKIEMVVEETDGQNVIKAASIVTAINKADSKVFIEANHVNIDGKVTFTSMTEETKKNIVISTVISYGLSDSTETQPTSWQTTPPERVAGKFLWQKTVTTMADNSFTTSIVCLDKENGLESYTILLSNEMHTFAGTKTAAKPNQSVTVEVTAYQGNTPATVTVTGIESSTVPQGIRAEIITDTEGHNTNKFKITTLSDPLLTTPSGDISVNIRIGGEEGLIITKKFNYAIAFQGEDGKVKLITLSAPSNVFVKNGSIFTPATIIVTGSASDTTINDWLYSINGGNYTTNAPTYVTEGSGFVTVTGSGMSAAEHSTLGIKAQDLDGTTFDVLTLAMVENGKEGAAAYSILLDNESHTFAATESGALEGSTTCGITAKKGSDDQVIKVNDISTPGGMSAAVSGNSTKNPIITFYVSSLLNTDSGTVSIPLTIDGKSFTKKFSYSLARQGKNAKIVNLKPTTLMFNVTDKLPGQYTRLSYITADGKQWIDTGFAPNLDTMITSEFSMSELSSNLLYFTSTSGFDNASYGFYRSSDSKTFLNYDSNTDISAKFTPALNTKYKIKLDKHQLFIDDVLKDNEPATDFQSARNLLIGSNQDSDDYKFKGNLYSFKIWDNTNLIRNFIPARRNSDNAIGLFDRCSKQKNLFKAIKFVGMSEDRGVYSNTETDTRTVFWLLLQYSTENTAEAIVAKSQVTTLGLNSFTFTYPNTSEPIKQLRIKHNGAVKDLSVYIDPSEFVAGKKYTLQFNLLAYNPSVVNGFSLKNILIEEGEEATYYEPYQGFYSSIGSDPFIAGTDIGATIVAESIDPETIIVTAEAQNTTVTSSDWSFSLDGGTSYSTTIPKGVSISDNKATLTGKDLEVDSIVVKVEDTGKNCHDICTISKIRNGTQGNDGASVIAEEIQYLLTDSATKKPTGQEAGWTTERPAPAKDQGYIHYWTRIETTLKQGNTTKTIHSTPKYDYTNSNIAQWCKDNDLTIIDGGVIATGTIYADSIVSHSIEAEQIKAGTITADEIAANTITAGKLATDAIKSSNYKEETTGVTGTFLNLFDGAITSKNFKIDSSGNATFNGGGTFSGELSAATGSFKGRLEAAEGSFAGELSAATGTFEGTVTAEVLTANESGSIAGWSISKNRLSSGSFELNSNAKGDAVAVKFGDNFKVLADGTVQAATIVSSAVNLADSHTDGKLSNKADKSQTTSKDHRLSWSLGSDEWTINKVNTAGTATNVFKVNADGLTVNGTGTFNGDVTCSKLTAHSEGDIANWTIGTNSLTSGNVGISSASTSGAYSFWAGNSTAAYAPFWVKNTGELKASNATIEGTLKATGGQIAGWYVNGNQLQNAESNPTVLLNGGATGDNVTFKAGDKFSVTAGGKLTANSGKIGMFTITDYGALQSNTTDLQSIAAIELIDNSLNIPSTCKLTPYTLDLKLDSCVINIEPGTIESNSSLDIIADPSIYISAAHIYMNNGYASRTPQETSLEVTGNISGHTFNTTNYGTGDPSGGETGDLYFKIIS